MNGAGQARPRARVAVVGGGVSGLATAFRLASRSVEVTVLEAADHSGGALRTVEVGGLTLPAGTESFLARKPAAVQLCRDLGLGGELVPPAATGSWLWTDRGLVGYPTGTAFGIPGDVGDVFRWPGLSRAGRRRALLDLVKRARKGGGDETLGSLLRRRLGDEATDLALAPLLTAPCAGDVDRLSVRATFPELEAFEGEQGSLIRGAQAALRRARGAAPVPMHMTLREGIARLPEALAAHLGARVRTDARVQRLVACEGGGWRLTLADGATLDAGAVVLATGAEATRELLDPVARAAAAGLEGIPSASAGSVLLVYPEGTQEALPAGSGFLVPRGRAPMLACSWLSSAWPHPSHGTRAVLRCTVGGVGDEDVLEADDDDIVRACARHLAAVVPLPEAPAASVVVRWPHALPQYELGHVERVARLRERLPRGIFVTGPSFDGVGVAECAAAAAETAEGVAAYLASAGLGPTTDQETAG